MMRTTGSAGAVCALALLAGCGTGTEGDAVAGLEGRVTALERRSKSPAAAATAVTDDDDDVATRLDADVRSLERRLAALEEAVAALREWLDAGDGVAGDAGDGRGFRARRQDRRERLRSLTAEYRDRLAAVREEFRAAPDDPGKQEALREIVDWYRTERRTIMRDR